MQAAERLFAERGPDAVGIQQVAREAGVSHPLIIHYFGSYEVLVREVLSARNQRLATEVMQHILKEGMPVEADAIISAVLKALSDPAHARLLAYTALNTERAGVPSDVPRMVAEMLAMRVRERAKARGVAPPSQARITRSFLIVTSAVFGFATFRNLLLPTFGLEDDANIDAKFRAGVRAMLDEQLWRELSP